MSKNQLLERKDIPQELTWDLTLIYANTAEWEKDFADLNLNAVPYIDIENN